MAHGARHCVRCGVRLPEASRFCPSCGAAVVSVSLAAAAGAAAAPAAFASPVLAAPVPAGRPANPQRSTAVIWLFVSAFGAAAAAAPFVFEIDFSGGGGALVLAGLLMAITGFVVALMYFGRASTLDRILSGRDLLARWRYRPEEWARYAEAEFGREKADKKTLFLIVGTICLVVGLVFLVAEPEAGRFVFLVLLGVVALCGLAAVVSTFSNRRRNRSRVGEAFISPSAVYLNGELHSWSGFGGRLESVRYQEGSPPYLEFTYSMPARHQRQIGEVRVPVPQGQEPVARGLAGQLEALARSADQGR